MTQNIKDNERVIPSTDLDIHYNSTLCIHARFCVLQGPQAFKANTPGEWIYPEAMSADKLTAVIRNCPSGALSYSTNIAETAEDFPQVNQLRVRENGPLAVNGEIYMGSDKESVKRRTLCRCGASKNKPYCDTSHLTINFKASGEPHGGEYPPLAQTNGPVHITPLPDGPLEIKGAMEYLTGTARTFDKAMNTLLCRCGSSSAKPYCDGTHSRTGFTDQPDTKVNEAANPPSLAQWAGGLDAIKELTRRFYAKVGDDEILAPLFSTMAKSHAEFVAEFIAEVFGGGSTYTNAGGSHIGMIAKHLGKHITETQREHWLEVMLITADEVGLPSDPEFRTAFFNYLDWGSRLAVINSAEGIKPPTHEIPMPLWGWGAAQGPTINPENE